MATTPENLTEIGRRNGRMWWEFWRSGVRHEIKAADCVTAEWPVATFEAAALAWAQQQSQALCTLLDAEEALSGRVAVACEKFEQVIGYEVQKQVKAAVEYLRSHPGTSASTVAGVLRPRVVSAIQAIRGITAGF